MRLLIIFLIIPFFCSGQYFYPLLGKSSPSGSNWTIIGTPSAVNGTTISANTTGANFVAIAVSNYLSSGSISATGGMTFSIAKGVNYTGVYTTIFYAYPTSGQTSISTTFTLVSGSYSSMAVLCAYNPVIPTLDQTAGLGSGSSLISPSITPSYTYELILNALSFDNAAGVIWNPATGWTGFLAAGSSSHFALGFEYYIYAGTSAISATTTGTGMPPQYGNIICSWAQ
jgi:hypothetical protein